jgi:chromate transporter
MNEPSESTQSQPVPITQLFLAWFWIGLNSFGGGQSTLAMIQRSLASQKGWINDSDFAKANAMVNLAPGINLIAITILIGYQLRKVRGVIASLSGLLIPSITVTILMTAGYTKISRIPDVIYAFHGIVPATVGIGTMAGILILFSFIRVKALQSRTLELIVCFSIVIISYILMQNHIPAIFVILLGGTLLSTFHHFLHIPQPHGTRNLSES